MTTTDRSKDLLAGYLTKPARSQKRQVIGVFGDDDVGQGALGRQPAFDHRVLPFKVEARNPNLPEITDDHPQSRPRRPPFESAARAASLPTSYTTPGDTICFFPDDWADRVVSDNRFKFYYDARHPVP